VTRQTAVWLPATGTDQATRTLRADAALLGLDEAAARSGSGRGRIRRRIVEA
jgi:hypothetical protein